MTFAHTQDLSDGFFEKLKLMCARLEMQPLDCLKVMMAESGVSAHARNPGSSATGLIQFMHQSWRDTWGFERDAFASLTAEDQLKYVEEYFRPWKGRYPNVTAVYCAVFLPVMLQNATKPQFVVAAPLGPFNWVYTANRGLDADSKGYIVIDDLRKAVERHCRGPRWDEIVLRLGGQSVSDVQRQLTELGFDPGAIDGVSGPKTMAAVKAFQSSKGLVADGIVGPLTMKALFDP